MNVAAKACVLRRSRARVSANLTIRPDSTNSSWPSPTVRAALPGPELPRHSRLRHRPQHPLRKTAETVDAARHGRINRAKRHDLVDLRALFEGENIGITRLASLGNKLNVDETDILPALLEHEPTRIVFMYLEGIRHGRALFDIAQNSPKPIVLFKGNISPVAARIARSQRERPQRDARCRSRGQPIGHHFGQPLCRLRVDRGFVLAAAHGREQFGDFRRLGRHGRYRGRLGYRTSFDLVPLREETGTAIEGKFRGGYLKIANPVDIGDFFDVRGTLEMIELSSPTPVDGMLSACST